MKKEGNTISLVIEMLIVAIFIGCASPPKESLLDDPAEPVQSTKSASFESAGIRSVAIVALDKNSEFPYLRGHADPYGPIRAVLEDRFTASLLKKGYTVSSRSDVQSVLKEVGFQNSGLTESNAATLGRMLNVSAVLLARFHTPSADRGTSSPSEETVTVSLGARLIGVSTAELLWIGTHRVSKRLILPPNYGVADAQSPVTERLISEAARDLAATFPELSRN
jgi:hypothetical protein